MADNVMRFAIRLPACPGCDPDSPVSAHRYGTREHGAQPKMVDDECYGPDRLALTSAAVARARLSGHETPDIHDIYNAAVELLHAARTGGSPHD